MSALYSGFLDSQICGFTFVFRHVANGNCDLANNTINTVNPYMQSGSCMWEPCTVISVCVCVTNRCFLVISKHPITPTAVHVQHFVAALAAATMWQLACTPPPPSYTCHGKTMVVRVRGDWGIWYERCVSYANFLHVCVRVLRNELILFSDKQRYLNVSKRFFFLH